MLFNSIHFCIFFPLITVCWFLLPFRFRNFFLLSASYFFYMCWKPEYVLILLLSTVIDYTAALKMESADDSQRKKLLLLSICSNLGLLFLFKYYNFFSTNLRALIPSLDLPHFRLLLPIGISFYTFQTLSYTIDVYRKKQSPEKNFIRFALYVTFFPQLVAGPIERSGNLLPQFSEIHRFSFDNLKAGILQMLRGFFKKIVIADNLAVFVDHVYKSPSSENGLTVALATVMFAYQIYCDFSGYSDIAIGSARILGFSLMKNFNRPYIATSIRDFWKRWHISLSTWFRDYLYLPLGGKSEGIIHLRNILAVFLLSGIWHGANWTFIVWGAMHGLFYLCWPVSESGEKPLIRKIPLIFLTFLLVNLSWIFFRSPDLASAITAVSIIMNFNDWSISGLLSSVNETDIGLNRFYFCLLLMPLLELYQFLEDKESCRNFILRLPLFVRLIFVYSAVYLLITAGLFDSREFIYFQF